MSVCRCSVESFHNHKNYWAQADNGVKQEVWCNYRVAAAWVPSWHFACLAWAAFQFLGLFVVVLSPLLTGSRPSCFRSPLVGWRQKTLAVWAGPRLVVSAEWLQRHTAAPGLQDQVDRQTASLRAGPTGLPGWQTVVQSSSLGLFILVSSSISSSGSTFLLQRLQKHKHSWLKALGRAEREFHSAWKRSRREKH